MSKSTKSSTCRYCGMPVKAKQDGSLSDWINICTCKTTGTFKAFKKPNVVCCRNCGKQMQTARKGSMTSWIFQIDFCSCNAPEADVEVSIDEELEMLSASLEELEKSAKIDLIASQFPVDRYKPLRLIGFGESGIVYLSKDLLLNKKVAVKQIHFTSEDDYKAFQKEAKTTARLEHPNIVKVLEFDTTESGIPYMVSDYVNGIPLSKLMRSKGRLEEDEAFETMIQVCAGMSHAHHLGILHGDLTPQNIMLIDANLKNIDVKLIDFGMARQVADNERKSLEEHIQQIGSHNYLAPDKVLGHPFSESSEIYSLGCIFYEMLTGKPPYSGNSPLNTMQLHVKAEIPSLSEVNEGEYWHASLEEAIQKALAKDPDKRFDSVEDFKQKLLEIRENYYPCMATEEELSEKPLFALSDKVASAPESDLDKSKKKDTILFVSAAALLVLIAGGLFSWFLGQDPTQSEDMKRQLAVLEKKKDSSEGKARDIRDPVELFTVAKRVIPGTRKRAYCATARYNMTDKDLVKLNKYPKVESLLLTGTQITGTGLKNLNLLKPTNINLSRSKLTDEGLKVISNIPSLTTLNIDTNSNITSAGFKHLAKLKNLRSLHLSETNLKDEDLKYIGKLKKLTALDIGYNENLTEDAVKKLLRSLPRLRNFSMPQTSFGLKVLDEFTPGQLWVLNIMNTGATDDDLINLKQPHIFRLSVADIELTDRGIESLVRLKRLRLLHVGACPNVSNKAADYLRKKLRIYISGI